MDYDIYQNEAVSEELAKKLDQMGLDKDLPMLMKDRRFRKFMFMLLYQICGLDDCTFTGNSKTYFLEGKREVGRFVHERLQLLAHTDYINMLIEIKKGFGLEEEE